MKKVLMLASVASMIDKFNMDNIKILEELGYSVDIAANFDFGSITSDERVCEFKQELAERGNKVFNIPIPRKISDIKNNSKFNIDVKLPSTLVINDNEESLLEYDKIEIYYTFAY